VTMSGYQVYIPLEQNISKFPIFSGECAENSNEESRRKEGGNLYRKESEGFSSYQQYFQSTLKVPLINLVKAYISSESIEGSLIPLIR